MTEKTAPDTSAEVANAVNLVANPFAGAAALSMMGFGFASQAVSLWVGAVSGMAQASQKMLSSGLADAAPTVEDFAERKSASLRAETATKILIADVRSVAARKLAEPLTAAIPESKPRPGLAAQPALAPEAVGELMPEDFRRPRSVAKPQTPDDLKAISGIGPKLEQVLNGLGVWSFAQIAAWKPQEIAWVDDYLGFKGRIGRDDWIGQAAKFAAGLTKH